MRCPSGLNATADTTSVWPIIGCPMGWPVSASHSRTVLSKPPETTRCPSGLNATLHTNSVLPVNGFPMGWPVSAFHTRSALSSTLAVTMRCPSGLNDALMTIESGGVIGLPTGWPVPASQTCRVPCLSTARILRPSGLNATFVTPAVWPGERWTDGLAGLCVAQLDRVADRGDDTTPVGAEPQAGYRTSGRSSERRCRSSTSARSGRHRRRESDVHRGCMQPLGRKRYVR